MYKIYRIVLMLIAMAGSSSCLGKVKYYEHEPTHSFRGTANKMKSSSFKKLLDFSDNGVVFVPDFTEMVPRRIPRSFLIFYSMSKASIYIENIILYSGSKTHKKELVIDKEILIDKKFKSFFEGSTFLFGGKEFLHEKARIKDYEKIWSEDSAILEVYYWIPNEGVNTQLKKMEFKFDLKTSTEIAWST